MKKEEKEEEKEKKRKGYEGEEEVEKLIGKYESSGREMVRRNKRLRENLLWP